MGNMSLHETQPKSLLEKKKEKKTINGRDQSPTGWNQGKLHYRIV